VQCDREGEARLTDSVRTISGLRENLDDVRRDSLTDGLTSVANRKRFDVALRDAAAQAMEVGEPLTLLMLDVDHFTTSSGSTTASVTRWATLY
jgi:diguanylate cyclase